MGRTYNRHVDCVLDVLVVRFGPEDEIADLRVVWYFPLLGLEAKATLALRHRHENLHRKPCVVLTNLTHKYTNSVTIDVDSMGMGV